MHIISTLLLLATSAAPTYGHTLLRGYLPTQELIGVTNNNDNSDELLGTSWAVTHLAYAEDTDGEMTPVLEDSPATVTFSETAMSGYVSGNAGCNYITGFVTITSSSLEFTNTLITQMWCFDEEVSNQEYALFAVFRDSVPYKITITDEEDQVLTLYHDETGEPIARLVPLPEPTPNNDNNGEDVLLGTSWAATDIFYTDDGKMRPVLEDYPATVIFSNHHTVIGYAGCNQFEGDVTMTSTTLVFDTPRTNMGCSNDVMQQEHAFGDAIFWQRNFTVQYEITSTGDEDEVLLLYNDNTGELTARLVPLPEPTLVESEWEVNGVPHSLWMADQPLTLSFDDESNFSGHSGCNSFSGEWEEMTEEGDGQPLFLTKNMRVTKKLCHFDDEEQEQGVMEQEQKFLGALRQDVVAYEISPSWGGRLILYGTRIVDDEESNDASAAVHVGEPLVILSKPRVDENDDLWVDY